MALFRKNKYKNSIRLNPSQPDNYQQRIKQIPDGATFTCPGCKKALVRKDLPEDRTCRKCHYPLQFPAYDRIDWLLDSETFEELDAEIDLVNPINFPDYTDKLKDKQENTGLQEAVVTGLGKFAGQTIAVGVMDSRFIMASMGHIVGEKLTRLFEKAIEKRLPVVLYIASGGARMQEGIISLMQMAKVSQVVAKHDAAGLFYLAVLTQPTTGGVTASFANQADIILAEPKATIGFAGKRVIKQTIHAELPHGFQESETVLKNGFIDSIVSRDLQKEVIRQLLTIHSLDIKEEE